jgi:hypothetical protein
VEVTPVLRRDETQLPGHREVFFRRCVVPHVTLAADEGSLGRYDRERAWVDQTTTGVEILV